MPKGIYLRTKPAWNKGLKLGPNPRHSEIMKKKEWSKEIIEKRRIASIGKKRSVQGRINISNGRKGMKFSEKHRTNIAKSKSGSKNPNWLGGKTPENVKRFNSILWKKIREQILRRDKHTCQSCGGKGNDVHHIKPYRICKSNDLNNLITLCRSCHRKEDGRNK